MSSSETRPELQNALSVSKHYPKEIIMRDKAYVIKIDRGTIWVTPLLSDTCINCTHPVCTRRGTPFPVTNPLKLTVKTGDIVEYRADAPNRYALLTKLKNNELCLTLI